ncbi:MAG: tRNA epoxyqueuosine(34) reductase QueG [Acidobacteriota bacterium]|jgi:epoxyqueuosine reductase|nr:tRNA epoxyqueuosine(34) reductase QueG [Acidobacteriota bacterium]
MLRHCINYGGRHDAGRLTADIRNEALKIGFAKTGFAPAGKTPFMAHFRDWLRDGLHGEMRYLERQAEKRGDPELVLPGVRSIVVAALNYYSGETPPSSPLEGNISLYARGADYHPAVMDRLKRLLRFIKSAVPQANGLCYADTGPVMEKVWGAETSVGWIGKHSGLVSRELGTRFFIGVILLDIPLAYDEKSEALCGDCRRCMDACPTGALAVPYRLDAGKCLSYLTIEFHGTVPPELRSLAGNRIFGCDECQNACPWNRFAVKTTVEELTPRKENLAPELLSLAGLSREAFERRFAASPVLRASRDGFVRNVMIALGNSRRAEAVPALKAALLDESPLVRAHAEWALKSVTGGH